MKVIRLASAVLASAVLLAACSQGKPSGSSADPSSEQISHASGTGSENPAASAGPVSFPLEQPVTLTAFVLHAQAVADMTDNYVTDLLRQKTNVTLDFKHNVMDDDGKTKLNLLMASNDLPDIFLRTAWTKAEALLYGTQGLIIPLNDYLKDLPLWNEYNVDRPTRLGDITLPDGNIYSYGGGGGSGENHVNYQARMWVYKPWIDSLMDGKMPETTAEFYEFLTRIKNNDPNGNGIPDEIPLSGSIAAGQWATDPTNFILNAFLQTNTFISNTNSGFQPFIVDNGKVVFQFSKDEYRLGLEYLNRLFREGLLDNQTFTQDGTQLNAAGSANDPHILGACGGGFFGSFSDSSSFSQGIVDDTWSNWTLLSPLEGPNGARYSYYTLPGGGLGNGYVSRSCKNPNLAVNIFEFLTTPEMTLAQSYGPMDVAWEFVDGGPAVDGGQATWKRNQPEKYKENGEADWGLPFATLGWPADVQISSLGRFKSHELVEDTATNLEYLLYQAQMEYGKYRPPLDPCCRIWPIMRMTPGLCPNTWFPLVRM